MPITFLITRTNGFNVCVFVTTNFVADIDECNSSTNNTICDESRCTNTDGSYHCSCRDGYILSNISEQSCDGKYISRNRNQKFG